MNQNQLFQQVKLILENICITDNFWSLFHMQKINKGWTFSHLVGFATVKVVTTVKFLTGVEKADRINGTS